MATIKTYLTILMLLFLFLASSTYGGLTKNFEANAQTLSDFPIEQSVWNGIGHLIHYGWGFSVYIYVNQSNFYYQIVGGSEYYETYFSINPFQPGGYEINEMRANYLLSSTGGTNTVPDASNGGLFQWNQTTTKWAPKMLANITTTEPSGIVWHSATGEVAFSVNQGKVNLALMGNPSKIWMVFRAVESGGITAPQNSFAYLDIANNFAAAFVVQKEIGPIEHPGTAFPPEPKSWAINRLETANATVIFKNYGENLINNVTANITAPLEVVVLNGTTSWSTSLDSLEQTENTLTLNRTEFGTSELQVTFTYESVQSGEIGPVVLPQKLTMIPRVDMILEGPSGKVLWGQPYSSNLTVINKDPLAGVVTVQPAPSWKKGDIISVMLYPFANVTLYPTVIIQDANMGFAAFFEEILLQQVFTSVDMKYPPNLWVHPLVIDSEPYSFGNFRLEITRTHLIQATLENEESASYVATLVFKVGPYGSGQLPSEANGFLVNQSRQVVTLPPNSNTTVSILLMPLDIPRTTPYTEFSLTLEVEETPIRYREFFAELVSPSQPLISPVLFSPPAILIYLTMFAVGVLVKTLYSRRIRGAKEKQIK